MLTVRAAAWVVIFFLGCSTPTPSVPDAGAADAGAADAGAADAGGELAACAGSGLFSLPVNAAAPATVTIDAAAPLGPVRYLQGFLNGISPVPNNTEQFDPAVVQALRPRFWRIGTGAGTTYPKVKDFNATLTVVLSDLYADSKGGYSNAKPFENWPEYEATIRAAVANSVTAGLSIRYWEVWGEPQGGTPWLGTYDQLLELYKRTADVVAQEAPTAKLIGPAFDDFEGRLQGKSMTDFLADLDARYGLRLAGVSWHELGNQPPEAIPQHAAQLRQFLATALPGSTPELHVNEFSGPADHLLPGAAVGWLYYLMAAQVDVASRACWDVPEVPRWSDCWAGLDGLLRPDNKTPMPSYWAHRFYADLEGATRLTDTPSDPRDLAIAARDAAGVLHLLVARLESGPVSPTRPLVLKLDGLTAARYRVESSSVAALTPPVALTAPTVFPPCEAPTSSGGLTLELGDVANFSVVSLRLVPR